MPDDELKTLYALFERVNPYRPLDKYEQIHGWSARSWEALNDRGELDWEGHCLGGSMASILLNQPTPAGGTPYNQDELEGLWAELGERREIYSGPIGHSTGEIPIPPGPPEPGPDPTDDRVARIHALFEQCIRHEQVALYSNLRADGTDPDAVWNHAVYTYTATYSEAPGGNERILHIVNDIKANDDYMPPTNDARDRAFTYTYEVKYSGGTVQEGVGNFISVAGQAHFAPERLAHVTQANWDANNPFVFLADVLADDGAN